MQKQVSIIIGSFRLRNEAGKFSPCRYLHKIASPNIAESYCEKVAKLLVDCYNEYKNQRKENIENDEREFLEAS